jgi:hypothetical protein
MANIYTEPEAYGLTVVAEVEAFQGWEFDTFVIWQDKQGTYWWAHDQGCSCPIPFDGKDLSNLPSGSLEDAINDLKAWTLEENYNDRARKAVKTVGLLLTRLDEEREA